MTDTLIGYRCNVCGQTGSEAWHAAHLEAEPDHDEFTAMYEISTFAEIPFMMNQTVRRKGGKQEWNVEDCDSDGMIVSADVSHGSFGSRKRTLYVEPKNYRFWEVIQ